MDIDIEKSRRETARWRILVALNAARPGGAYEGLILSILVDCDLLSTPSEVRRELDYLRDRKLIEIDGEDSGRWYAHLTRCGVDLVEYTIPCDPGIARPEKW